METLILNLLVYSMLALAAANRFCRSYSCTLLQLLCPPPTIFSGRGVPFSNCSQSRAKGSTGKRHCDACQSVSHVSERFSEKTFRCARLSRGQLLSMNSSCLILSQTPVMSLFLKNYFNFGSTMSLINKCIHTSLFYIVWSI